tara:strand:- start:3023 stop:3223 length:201 start_codon:yes stop_codon:yes gene_type:complete
MEEKQYMSLKEVYKFLSISKGTMRTILNNDETFPKPYPLISDSPRAKRYNRDEVIEWAESKKKSES